MVFGLLGAQLGGYWGNYSLSQIKNGAMLNAICGAGPVLERFLIGPQQISSEIENKRLETVTTI